MPRLNKLDDVLFPVEEHPVFANIRGEKSEWQLPVPYKKAIVDVKNGRVVGVVSQGYQLVSNREALHLGYECCRTVFPETHPEEWLVEATDAPATGSHCFIDLVHNSAKLDFSDVPANKRPEVYGPFIRVTNSYNGLRSLLFDIGFYRKVCKNGLILPETIIQFRFTHQKREIGSSICFEVEHTKLQKLKTTFISYIDILRNVAMAQPLFEPLVRGVLLLRPPKEMDPKSREAHEWGMLKNAIHELSKRYADDLGENAYAAFNAITDFASNPPSNLHVRRERHSLQRLAGEWLTTFSAACCNRDFTVEKYLENLTKTSFN